MLAEEQPRTAPTSSLAPSGGGTGLHYSRIAELGQGGMADVYLAVARGPGGFNKLVVLKTIRRQLVVDTEVRRMFLEEARLSARLNHSNIVHVYEVVDHPTTPAIVMEYLDGQSLSAVLNLLRPRLTLGMQLRIIQDVLIGLQHSHELRDYDGTPLNIVHRDVSPQNVFVTYDGIAKVLDFGIAKVAAQPTQTRTGVIKGKLAYMPPEQLLGDPTDRRADVYAVGCILWDFLAGQRLWHGWADGAIMRAIIDGQIPSPSELSSTVDPELEALAMKALAPNPENRFPTALAFADEVERYANEHGLSGSRRELSALLMEGFEKEREERSASIRRAIAERDAAPLGDTGDTPPASTITTTSRTERPSSVKLLFGIALLAVVGVAAFVLSVRAADEPTAPAASAPAPREYMVRAEASPAHAKLRIDGELLAGNPAVLRKSDDGAEHIVQASADGFVTQSRAVRFDREVAVFFSLERVPAQAATASAAPTRRPEPTFAPVRPQPRPTASVTASKPVPKADCSPPFRIQNGVKVFKPECL